MKKFVQKMFLSMVVHTVPFLAPFLPIEVKAFLVQIGFFFFFQDFGMDSKEDQAGGDWGGGGHGDDFGEVEAKGDSDMEGWEDDGWGTFDSPPAPTQPPASKKDKPVQELSSGADFFDNMKTSRSSERTQESRDLFEDFGFSKPQSSRNAQKDRTPPPFTSASLFGGGDTGRKSAESVKSDKDEEAGGWGDWNSDFDDVKPSVKV